MSHRTLRTTVSRSDSSVILSCILQDRGFERRFRRAGCLRGLSPPLFVATAWPQPAVLSSHPDRRVVRRFRSRSGHNGRLGARRHVSLSTSGGHGRGRRRGYALSVAVLRDRHRHLGAQRKSPHGRRRSSGCRDACHRTRGASRRHHQHHRRRDHRHRCEGSDRGLQPRRGNACSVIPRRK